jgi:outer membrane protein OmpA-like peptidoglycan-associated protein
MRSNAASRNLFPSQLAILVLASAVGFPAFAQQAQPAVEAQNTPPVAAQQSANSANATAKEGFWGRVNPFARKKWVKKQTDPINDRLGELDEVNAKNARDIQDVDSRAQAGIRKAQATADGANQTASAATDQAQRAGATAQGAAGRVDRLNATVGGLDQYRQISEVEVAFRGVQPVLSEEARKQLDELAANLSGHQGYILEIEAHAPAAGSVGIQSSERLAEAVKRYLVTEHQIPVYRLHAVALGNAQATGTGQEDAKPARIKSGSVHIRLMENSLAAQGAAPPQGTATLTGAERP